MRLLVVVSIVICAITLLHASSGVRAHVLPPSTLHPRQGRPRSCCNVDYCQTSQQKDTCKTESPDDCCHACKGSPSQCGEEPRTPPPRRPPPTPPRRRDELIDSLLPRKKDKCCSIDPCRILLEVQTCSTDLPLPCCHGCKGSQFCPKPPPQRRDELTDSLLPRRPEPCCDTDPCHTAEEIFSCSTRSKLPCCDGCRGDPKLCGNAPARPRNQLADSLLPRAQQPCCALESCQNEVEALSCLSSQKLPCCDGCKGNSQLCGKSPAQPRNELVDSLLLPRQPPPPPYTNCCEIDPCPVWPLDCGTEAPTNQCCFSCKKDLKKCPKSTLSTERSLESTKDSLLADVGSGLLPRVPAQATSGMLLPRQIPPPPYENCCEIPPCNFPSLCDNDPSPEDQCCYSCQKESKCKKKPPGKRSLDSPESLVHREVFLSRAMNPVTGMLFARDDFNCCNYDYCGFDDRCSQNSPPVCCFGCKGTPPCQGGKSPGQGRFKPAPPPYPRRSLDSAVESFDDRIFSRSSAGSAEKDRLLPRQLDSCCQTASCATNKAMCGPGKDAPCCTGCQGSTLCNPKHGPGKRQHDERSLESTTDSFNDDTHVTRSALESAETDLSRRADSCCDTAPCATLNEQSRCTLPGHKLSCCSGCKGSPRCNAEHSPRKRHHDERSLESTAITILHRSTVKSQAQTASEILLARDIMKTSTLVARQLAPCCLLARCDESIQPQCSLKERPACCDSCRGDPDQCGRALRQSDAKRRSSEGDQHDDVDERSESSDFHLLSRASSEPDALVRVPKTTPHCCNVDRCSPGYLQRCGDPDAPDCCDSCKGDKRCHRGANALKRSLELPEAVELGARAISGASTSDNTKRDAAVADVHQRSTITARENAAASLLPRKENPCCTVDTCGPGDQTKCGTQGQPPCCDGCRGDTSRCGSAGYSWGLLPPPNEKSEEPEPTEKRSFSPLEAQGHSLVLPNRSLPG
ncbi:hypothetical protein IE81DRAFT_142615 [Ceraceosorus guamensis]|uniref:Disintegrin domain-containing protein n=1 Tax=Ceraceosorus guamensis TaxID=1522189 RepID=A0A316VYY0_9BASI|nr:hypothetical protein IE81DRAFT_142615 [Ceraceosorus guamensis]PWN42108.1 hypothetical protein IE81DRAFT_142615 [Ceraceosorus guamensis]